MNFLRKVVLTAAVAALAVGMVGRAEAQVLTVPFMPPQPESSFGVYLSDYADLAIEGIGRWNFGEFDMGLRGGVIDFGSETVATIGGEFRNPLSLGTDPLDLALTAGVQGLLGDIDGWGAQAGLSVGHTFIASTNGLRFTPYVHPRVAYVDFGGGDGDVEVLADIGFDVAFATGLSLRFGANLGDGADWGLGVAWRR